MTKVITFSQTFPAYHPKAGQPTDFVFKFWNSIGNEASSALSPYAKAFFDEFPWNQSNHEFLSDLTPKHHTIRAGRRFKAGDIFSPRVWGNDINPRSGRSGPYHSKQIVIGPDTLVEKTYDFNLAGGKAFMFGYEKELDDNFMKVVSCNDGLDFGDFIAWFKNFSQNMEGQIICWNRAINY